jgi:2,3-bisphosphoglycerate-dependent phosphoglycerate mutase
MKNFVKRRRLTLLLFVASGSDSGNRPAALGCWISEQFPVHTLLLCRHGDSIWNGGCPGQVERFTGWTDVPLSKTGEREALEAATQLNSYLHDIDLCFTSILSRAQATTRTCLESMRMGQQQNGNKRNANNNNNSIPPLHVDYRLNERHYGALQEFCKSDVEQGKFSQWQDADLIQQWRRSWFVRPPPMDDNDPRRLAELARYGNLLRLHNNNNNNNDSSSSSKNAKRDNVVEVVPNGESLEMVAKNRVRPFVDEVLTPLLDARAMEKRQRFGKLNGEWPQTTGLIVAHANS